MNPPEVAEGADGTVPNPCAEALGERCARVAVRFHGRYAHVGAYCYDEESPGKVESLPTHLCQLEYVGRPDMWGFASYKYSTERYERSYLPSGSMGGTPEECFDCAGLAYLQ